MADNKISLDENSHWSHLLPDIQCFQPRTLGSIFLFGVPRSFDKRSIEVLNNLREYEWGKEGERGQRATI